jgi:hypothetical protein
MQTPVAATLLRTLSRSVFWIVAAFYAYGALIHLLNMASLTGFSWPEAPLKWQALDVVYLLLDIVVAIGLVRGARVGIIAFFCAALSQIALYTVFRDWILDVPAAFRRSAEDVAYLDGLVAFHVVTSIAILAAIAARQRSDTSLATQ